MEAANAIIAAEARAQMAAQAFAMLSPLCREAITIEPFGGHVCDYSNLDLTYYNLMEGTFEGCRFDNAILTGVKLIGAGLETASFRGAILDGADMTGATCGNAVFDGASMTGTIMQVMTTDNLTPGRTTTCKDGLAA